MKINIKASDIARFLNKELIGSDMEIRGICSIDALTEGEISFLSRNISEDSSKKALILVRENKQIDPTSQNSYIKIPNPRLAFAKVINKFFDCGKEIEISSSAKISKKAIIGKNVSIGHNCVIQDGVVIGDNTIIRHNTIIADNTIIGRNCYIKSGSIIGEDEFGFEIEEGVPVRMPHLGKVIIHNNVEVGSLCTIVKATINDTIVKENVKIDDHVHIAHNCIVGKNTIITAQATIAGSVKIGENCWLGPNCSIIDGIKIGNNVKIGIGVVVTKNIEDHKIVMGLESLPLENLLNVKKKIGMRN